MKTYNDVSISLYQELKLVNPSDYKIYDDYLLEIYSILLDQPYEYFDNLLYDEFLSISNDLSFIFNEPPKLLVDKIDVGEELYLIDDLSKLTLGEFIDIGNLFVDFEKNLKLILAIVYKKIIREESLLYPAKYEEYGDYIYHREHLFSSVPISSIYGIKDKCLKFRETIELEYSGLFMDEVDVDEDENLSIRERAEIIEIKREEDKLKKWGWEVILYKLANNDFTKIEKVTKMNVIQALNMMSLLKECKL